MIGADTLRRCGAIERKVVRAERPTLWRVHGVAAVSLVAHFVGRAIRSAECQQDWLNAVAELAEEQTRNHGVQVGILLQAPWRRRQGIISSMCR